jgi:exonuclease V gamma subunit
MAWQVVYAQRAQDLWAALVGALGELRPDRGLLGTGRGTDRVILTPSRAVDQALKLYVAEATGVFANVAVERFAGWVHGWLERRGLRLVTRDVLLPLVHAALEPARLEVSGGALETLRAYLDVAPEARAARRRHRLAAALAEAWAGYGWSTPAWVDALRAGDAELVASSSRLGLGWLPGLAHAVLGPGGLLEARARRTGTPLVWPAELAEHGDPDAQLFVVGHVAAPPAMMTTLAAWAERVHVRAFVPAPSATYWEEREDGELAALARLGTAHRAMGVELERLGAPSWVDSRVDGLSALHEQRYGVRVEAEPHAPGPSPAEDGDGSLDALRAAWMVGRPAKAAGAVGLWAAPSARRLLEAVAAEIFARISAPGGPRLDEVAIHLVDVDAWAELEAVFAEHGELPFRWEGAPLARESVVVRAAEALVELPRTRLRREDVLRVLTSPCCRAAQRAKEHAKWATWAKRAGIYAGADAADRAAQLGAVTPLGAGVVERGDLRSWDQGLTRLVLGAIAPGDTPVELPRGRYVPAAVDADLGELGLFVGAARQLVEDARRLRAERHGFAGWSAALEALVDRHLTPADDGDRRALRQVMSALARLRALDDPAVVVPYAAAAEEALQQLGSLRAGLGAPEGVRVAPLELGEITPRRVTYVLGLSAGRFPRRDAPSELDLRRDPTRAETLLGPKSPLDLPREARDRAALLEVLLETREAVVLGYVARDERGQAVGPAEVVESVARALGLPPRPRSIPELRAQGVRPFGAVAEAAGPEAAAGSAEPEGAAPSASPDAPEPPPAPLTPFASDGARLEATLAAVRARAQVLLGRAPTLDELTRWRDDPRLAPLFGPADVPSDVEPPVPERLRISTLVDFLKNPLQASMKWRARRVEDALDALDAEPEPLELDAWGEGDLLLETIVRRSLDPGTSIEQLVDALLEREELEGRGPSGVFLDVNRQRVVDLAKRWSSSIPPTPLRRVALGSGRHATERVPPLVVETRRGAVALVGTLQPISADARLSVLVTADKAFSTHQRVTALVEHVVLAAAGLFTPGRSVDRRKLLRLQRKERGVATTMLPLVDPEDARAYLAQLTDALVSEPHPYWLPYDLAVQGGAEVDVLERAIVQAQLDLDAGGGLEGHEPVVDLGPYALPSLERLQSLYAERYALLDRLLPGRGDR